MVSQMPGDFADIAPSKLLTALSCALTYPAQGFDKSLEPLRACAGDASCARFVDRIEALLECAKAFTAPDVVQPQGAQAAQLEYTRLFIGSFKMYAPPYASYYLDGEQQVQGPTTVEIAALYDQFGLMLSDSEHDCADHIRYLLAFAARLALTYEEKGQDEFACAYRDFCGLYIASWADAWAKRVEDYAEFPFYPAVSRLVRDIAGKGVSDE